MRQLVNDEPKTARSAFLQPISFFKNKIKNLACQLLYLVTAI